MKRTTDIAIENVREKKLQRIGGDCGLEKRGTVQFGIFIKTLFVIETKRKSPAEKT